MIGLIESIGAAFRSGGLMMWMIVPIHVVSIVIIVERIIALYLDRSTNQRSKITAYETDIRGGDLDRVLLKAKKQAETDAIAAVAYAGAQAAQAHAGSEEIQLRMDEVLAEESSRIEKRTGFLAMVGNVATLLGLLGTITGMIKSFAGVASANAAEKAQLLAAGISEAMNATAYGLIVAVPALVMYAVLQNRAGQLTDDLNKAALKLYIWLTYNFDTGLKPVGRGSAKSKSN